MTWAFVGLPSDSALSTLNCQVIHTQSLTRWHKNIYYRTFTNMYKINVMKDRHINTSMLGNNILLAVVRIVEIYLESFDGLLDSRIFIFIFIIMTK